MELQHSAKMILMNILRLLTVVNAEGKLKGQIKGLSRNVKILNVCIWGHNFLKLKFDNIYYRYSL